MKPNGSAAESLVTASHMQSIEFQHFKSLDEVKVDLGAVNVFVGANGAGKSNLIEAVGLLSAAAAGRIDDQALLRRGVRPGVPRLYRTSFKGRSHRHSITLKATSRSGVAFKPTIARQSDPPLPWWAFTHESLTVDGAPVGSRSPRGANLWVAGKKEGVNIENHTSVASLVRASGDTEQRVREFLAVLDDYAIFAPVTPVLRGIAPDSAPRSPVGLYGGQLPEALSTFAAVQGSRAQRELQDEALAFIDWAEDFRVEVPSRSFIAASVPTMREVVTFGDRYMAKGRNRLSGYDASEGALYILFSLVLAMHPQAPRFFAIDNFDQALNPRAARKLTTIFCNAVLQAGRQVLLTTHNPLVLDGLPLDDDRVRLFRVERTSTGPTVVKRVPVRDVAGLKARSGEFAVSQLWISGRLGGMPDG